MKIKKKIIRVFKGNRKLNLSVIISVPLKSRQININQTIPEKGKN